MPSRVFIGILLLGIVVWGTSIAPAFASNDIIEILNSICFLLLVIFVPGAIILEMLQHGLFSRSWLPVACLGSIVLLSIFLIAPVTERLNEWQFNRQLQIYNRIIEGVKSQKIQVAKDGKIQNGPLPQPINYVRVSACSHGVVVEFHKQGRCGYLFDECGMVGSHYDHIRGAWYKYCAAD